MDERVRHLEMPANNHDGISQDRKSLAGPHFSKTLKGMNGARQSGLLCSGVHVNRFRSLYILSTVTQPFSSKVETQNMAIHALAMRYIASYLVTLNDEKRA